MKKNVGLGGRIIRAGALKANVSSQDRLACNEAGYLHETESQADTDPVKSVLLEKEPELADLVYAYIQQLPEKLARIRNAIDKRQWDELRDLVHQLKSTGGNYGFNGLSQLAAKLEVQVINQHHAEVEALMAELERYGQRIKSGETGRCR